MQTNLKTQIYSTLKRYSASQHGAFYFDISDQIKRDPVWTLSKPKNTFHCFWFWNACVHTFRNPSPHFWTSVFAPHCTVARHPSKAFSLCAPAPPAAVTLQIPSTAKRDLQLGRFFEREATIFNRPYPQSFIWHHQLMISFHLLWLWLWLWSLTILYLA